MASPTDIPQLPEIDHKQALEIEKSIQDLPNYIGNIEWEFVKRTGTKYAGYVVKPKQPFSEIVFGLFEIGGALGATGNWAPGYSEEEQSHPLLSANNVSEQSSPGKAQTVLSLRAIGDMEKEDDGIGVKSMRAIKKMDDMLVATIVEDARRVRDKDEDLAPIADMPKNLSKVFEEENDVEEYEKFHRRIKGDRMSLILKKPKSFDWGKYKKPNDTYTQDFYMPETAKGNIDTFIDGLKNAERKPTSKTPFVATITDKDGNKTRRTLTTVSYQSSNEEELKINDAILHEAGTSGGTLAILTLPIEDRNRIEANLDTAFVNLKLPFPNKVEMIAKLQSMGGTAASAGSAPSYMDKINSIVNGDTKRKRDVGDDEGKEDY